MHYFCGLILFMCNVTATIVVMKPTLLALLALAICTPLVAAEKTHKSHHKTVTKPATGQTSFSLKGADGSVKNYTLEIPSNSPAAKDGAVKISQQSAALAALGWAPTFYGATKVSADTAEFQTVPVGYYLVHMTGDIGGTRQPFYAAVLNSGQLVRPLETAGAPVKETHSKKAKKK
jgi:hypothetical protein